MTTKRISDDCISLQTLLRCVRLHMSSASPVTNRTGACRVSRGPPCNASHVEVRLPRVSKMARLSQETYHTLCSPATHTQCSMSCTAHRCNEMLVHHRLLYLLVRMLRMTSEYLAGLLL